MRRRIALLALVLVAAPALAAPTASVAFEGSFRATSGVGAAGAYPGGLSSPRGDLPVPADAVMALVVADWTRDTAAAQRLLLRLCEGDCAAGRILAEAEGQPPLQIEIDLPRSRQLSWEALVASGATVESHLHGTATFRLDAPAAPSPPDLVRAPAAVLGAIALALAALLLARRAALPLTALYHRIAGRDLLDHPTRARVLDAVAARPGIHFRGLAETTRLAQGALDHHLRLLVRAGLLLEHREPGARCFAVPGGLEPGLLPLLARVRTPAARAILLELERAGADSVRELAHRLGMPPSTLDDQLARLVAAGVVERTREGARHALSLTAAGRATARAIG